MIINGSAHRYKCFYQLHKVKRARKHHHKYLYTIVLTILLFDLRFCFMYYDSVFSSYDSVCHDKNVLFMQHKLQLFLEGSQFYHT